jgi:hypothetical protein
MGAMPQSVYRYIFRYSQKKQVVVILMTLALLPLAPIPLELQRRLLDDAVANNDIDLLIWLVTLYVGALLLGVGIKLAMRIQRELISAQIVHTLRSSVFIVSTQLHRPARSRPALMAKTLWTRGQLSRCYTTKWKSRVASRVLLSLDYCCRSER